MTSTRDKNSKKNAKAPREEFEVAYYTKELGRPLQRKMLQRQLSEISGNHISAAAHHGEETTTESPSAPPREDRAG